MSIEVAVIVLVGVVSILGLVWILYPAWLVYVAHDVEWEVEYLVGSSCDTDNNNNNNNNNNTSTDISSQQQQQQQNSSPTPVALLSLIIPAYNEQDRIAIMLRGAYEYLISDSGQGLLERLQQQRRSVSQSNSIGPVAVKTKQLPTQLVVEWIIVNDGSKDETCQVVRSTYNNLVARGVDKTSTSPSSTPQKHRWKIVTLKRNAGKGAAVKTGMLLASGQYHLMVDADGATDFGPGLERMVGELQKAVVMRVTPPVLSNNISNTTSDASSNNNKETIHPTTMMVAAFGSRAHLEKDSTVQRSFVRTVLMKAFHFFVSLFVSSNIHDTQCGFKLFTQESSTSIFETLHLRRWAFDTEIVLLCTIQNIHIVEVNVPWQEVDGSKLSTSKWALAIVSITMLRDMICVRMCYTFGIWNVQKMINKSSFMVMPNPAPLQATRKKER
jgi:dolichyl-phosphate beta-glucosyltransferase